MYALLVICHNVVRWFVVISGLIVTGTAVSGWIVKRQWKNSDRTFGLIFMLLMDIQILIGLVLFFFYSQWGLVTLLEKGVSFVMKNGEYRFFAIEHGFFMFLGLIFVHLGNSLPKKIEAHSKKFQTAALWFGLALILIVAGIPWESRPLFPGIQDAGLPLIITSEIWIFSLL